MADDTPSSLIKQQFITALRQTPAGIAGFLTAAIPTPPACSVPTDVDAAIIANGVCAAYVLDLFRPFAGVTPVELLLRIGQHNSVLESALLAGLQYLAESQAAAEFEIVEPTEGTVFLPGELRITARAKNETVITSIAGTLGAATFKLKAVEGVWRHYVDVEEGEQTLTLTATFATGDPVSQTVAFIVSADPVDPENPEDPPIDPEPPEKPDDPGINRLKDKFNDTYRKLIDDVQTKNSDTLPTELDALRETIATLGRTAVFTGGQGGASGGGGASGSWADDAQAALNEASALLPSIDGSGVADQISQLVGTAAGYAQKLITFLQDAV